MFDMLSKFAFNKKNLTTKASHKIFKFNRGRRMCKIKTYIFYFQLWHSHHQMCLLMNSNWIILVSISFRCLFSDFILKNPQQKKQRETVKRQSLKNH